MESFVTFPKVSGHSGTYFWALNFNPLLGRQIIADKPSLDIIPYEVKQPDSASSPVISDKPGQDIVSEAIVHFFGQVHIWWRQR